MWATAAVHMHAQEMSRAFADRFKVTRQAAAGALKRLVADGWLVRGGSPTRPTYGPGANRLVYFWQTLPVADEDRVWIDQIAPLLTLGSNVRALAMYCFTEIANNASDHSAGSLVFFWVKQGSSYLNIQIADNGVGIFKHIASRLGLPHPRLAILELSKGKLTTDPERHSGEGIFFSSRMCDYFVIEANDLEYSHQIGDAVDWLQDTEEPNTGDGTRVVMHFDTNTSRTTMQVFNEFTSQDGELSFDKTVVPVRLAKIGTENLVSRSQAKRLSAGFAKFRIVVLDFAGVEQIGQAFADELFRVFARANPTIELIPTNMSTFVDMMRQRVLQPS
jgi:hypothetical protein